MTSHDGDGASPGTSARLGFGLAAIGRPAYITTGRETALGDADLRTVDRLRERAHELLDDAWDLGIRYVDAARSYGLAESFIGSWLAAHPERRSQLTIGSKWGYEYVGDWRLDADVHEVKHHDLATFERQWPETLAALGTTPDLYLIHSLTPESPALGDAALLAALARLRDRGVRLGVSTSGPRQGEAIARAIELPDTPFSVVQATWNVLEPSAASALSSAHEAGWTVIVKEPVANGRLTAEGDEPGARELALEDGQTLDALAIGAALAQPWADVVLSGAITPAQLRENVAARPPSEETMAGLARLAQPAEEYWAARSARPWS